LGSVFAENVSEFSEMKARQSLPFIYSLTWFLSFDYFSDGSRGRLVCFF
jgi:hypothetical protein